MVFSKTFNPLYCHICFIQWLISNVIKLTSAVFGRKLFHQLTFVELLMGSFEVEVFLDCLQIRSGTRVEAVLASRPITTKASSSVLSRIPPVVLKRQKSGLQHFYSNRYFNWKPNFSSMGTKIISFWTKFSLIELETPTLHFSRFQQKVEASDG